MNTDIHVCGASGDRVCGERRLWQSCIMYLYKAHCLGIVCLLQKDKYAQLPSIASSAAVL